jgi:ABC-type bacteriocin/lantibiotic exporter with double-glycine peptidase domain
MIKYFKILNNELKIRSYLIIFSFFITTILEILAIGTTIPLIMGIGDISSEKIHNLPILNNFSYIFDNSENSIIILISLIFIFILVKNLILIILERIKNKFRRDMVVFLTTDLLDKYLSQDLFFHIKHNSTHLIKNIKEDCQFIVNTFIYMLKIFSDIFIFVFFSLILTLSNLILSLSMITTLAIFFLIFTYFTFKNLKNWGKEKFDQSTITSRFITESILNFKEVKLYKAKKFFLDRYKKSVNILYNVQNKFDNAQAYPRLILEVVILMIIVFFMFFLIINDTPKKTILLQISFFFIVGIRLSPIAVQIYKFFQTLKYTNPTFDKISRDLNMTEKNLNLSKKKITFNEKIVINNLSFDYDNGKNIIKNLSLIIKKKDFIGIFGKSGIGKTTLLEIILGLLPPKKGEIKSDKLDIYSNYLSWFNYIGYIPQNPILLDDTIVNNILFEKRHQKFNYINIEKCLKLVNLKFKKNEILSKKIGENGKKLSEGQKQRLAIARSLYRNPEILVLDEITSSLDEKNEKNIIKLLKKLNRTKTILFVSHKKTSLKYCNKVFEFRSNKLVLKKRIK